MLRRIPFWGWFFIILVTLYLVYNPAGVSVFHLWHRSSPVALPVRLLLTLLVLTCICLYVWTSLRSLGVFGFFVLSLIFTLLMWIAAEYGVFDPSRLGIWAWMAQPVVAVILTIGFHWRKFWWPVTGRVAVDERDAVH